jgi:tetratricopeptide (TPR) repeat protein
MQEQTQKNLEGLKMKVSEWLQPSNMREVLEHNTEQKLSGTCQWIWSNAKVTEWKSKTSSDPLDSRLLLVSGIPGCGKSILASAMVQSLQDESQQVLYFSFSDLDSTRQTSDHLVRSFLWQTLQDSQCAHSFEVMRKLIIKNQPISSDLWAAFAEITALRPQKDFIWIIDGLDESREPSADLTNLVKSQLQTHNNSRAALLGRPSSFPSGQSPAVLEIKLEMTAADIGSYIETEISKSETLRSSAMQSLALEKLQASAQGMFLWVKFMVNELNKPASNAVLKERLLKLPNGLKETYRRLLSSLLNGMDDIDRKTTKCLLSLIVAARRPLKVEELQYAQAIAAWVDSKSTTAFQFSEYGVENFSLQLTSLCQNLVYVSNGLVGLVHVSIKEFLTRTESKWTHPDDQAVSDLRICVADSQHLFCQICVRYLSVDDYVSPFTSNGLPSAEDGVPLLEYASRNFLYHSSQSEPRPEYLIDEIRRFAGSKYCLSWAENYSTDLFLGNTRTAIKDFETFIASVNRSGDGGEFLREFQGTLEAGIAERSAKFGEQDWRNDHLKAILPMLNDEDDEHTTNIDNTDANVEAQPAISAPSYPRFQEMAQMLLHNNSLPVSKQANLLFGLSYHLQKLKTLTDPLELLVRIILSKAAIIPAPVLLVIGSFYVRVGKEDKAMEVFQATVAKTEPDSYWGCLTRIQIGFIMKKREQFAEAEVWYSNLLLSLRTSFTDSDHLLNLTKFHLAESLYMQDKCAEAEQLYLVTAENWKRSGGVQDLHFIRSKTWAGRCLYGQEEYVKAELVFREVENLYEQRDNRVNDKSSNGALTAQYWLGLCLSKQNKLSEAEQILRIVFEGWKRVLGETNYNTLECARQLGMILYEDCKYSEARERLDFAIKGGETAWGKENLEILSAKTYVGASYDKEHKYEEAIEPFQSAFEGYERLQETEFPSMVAVASSLGAIFFDLERFTEAEKFLLIAVEGAKTDAVYRVSSITLVKTYSAQSKNFAAAELLEKMLSEKRIHIGTTNEDSVTFEYLLLLGLSLQAQGKYAEAEAELRTSLDGYTRLGGINNGSTLEVMALLTSLLWERRHYVEAEELLVEEIKGREIVDGMEHDNTLIAMDWLGVVKTQLGKHGEAEEIYRLLLQRRWKQQHKDRAEIQKAMKSFMTSRARKLATDRSLN